jgi:hypothetical protein
MAPTTGIDLVVSHFQKRLPEPAATLVSKPSRASLTIEGGFLEAWAQGYNVGSLVILILIVFCNYRSGIWLHKLILLEVSATNLLDDTLADRLKLTLAIWHGTFIFVEDPMYGWYLSATATLLFISYFLHNVVSWLKIRPFLPLWGSRLFIISLLCVQPFWVAEAWSNFSYFNWLGSYRYANTQMRPWEALVRDPWWIFTTWKLIKKTYGFKLWALIRINPRFGIMLLCMAFSIVFLATDIAVSAARVEANSGINPYWRFALVFKCASDTIFLDDFKSVLDDIVARKFSSAGGGVHRGPVAPPHHGSALSHKHSPSGGRGDPFIECTSLEATCPQHLHTSVTSSKSIAQSHKYLKPFSRKRQASVPIIHVQRETTVTTQARKPSNESWGSDTMMLPRPAYAASGSQSVRKNGSDASLFNGSMV